MKWYFIDDKLLYCKTKFENFTYCHVVVFKKSMKCDKLSSALWCLHSKENHIWVRLYICHVDQWQIHEYCIALYPHLILFNIACQLKFMSILFCFFNNKMIHPTTGSQDLRERKIHWTNLNSLRNMMTTTWDCLRSHLHMCRLWCWLLLFHFSRKL